MSQDLDHLFSTNNFIFANGATVSQTNGASTPSGNTADLSAYTAGVTFTQTATNSFNVTGMSFLNVGNLTGGSGNDTFILDANNLAIFTDLLDGGAGTDVLDMSNKTVAETINVDGSGNGPGSYIFGGFANFETVVASSATTDILSGTALADAFVLNSADAATVAGIAFSGIEGIFGLAGNDSFTVNGGMVANFINGGTGSDSIITTANTNAASGLNLLGVESVDIDHALTVTGTASINAGTGSIRIGNAGNGGSLVSTGDMTLSGNLLDIQAGSASALVQSGGNQTLNFSGGNINVTGSNTTAGANAQLKASGVQTIDALNVTVTGGSAANAFATIDPTLLTMNVSGAIVVQGGSGNGSHAELTADVIDLTAGGNIDLIAGLGNNAYAMIKSLSGDVTLAASNIALNAGTSIDADAVLHVNGGSGTALLSFSGTCTACNQLASDPFGNGLIEAGVFGLLGAAPPPPLPPPPPVVPIPGPPGISPLPSTTEATSTSDTLLLALNEIVVLDDLFAQSDDALDDETSYDEDESAAQISHEKQVLMCF